MKKLNVLTFLIVASVLILIGSCNRETSIEVFEDTNVQLESKVNCSREIIVTYNVIPIGSDIESANEIFITEMSQYFTICDDFQSKNCDNVFKWIVNGEEYDTYNTSINNGTGTDNNDDDGDIDIQEPGGWDNDNGCIFNNNFPF